MKAGLGNLAYRFLQLPYRFSTILKIESKGGKKVSTSKTNQRFLFLKRLLLKLSVRKKETCLSCHLISPIRVPVL